MCIMCDLLHQLESGVCAGRAEHDTAELTAVLKDKTSVIIYQV